MDFSIEVREVIKHNSVLPLDYSKLLVRSIAVVRVWDWHELRSVEGDEIEQGVCENNFIVHEVTEQKVVDQHLVIYLESLENH